MGRQKKTGIITTNLMVDWKGGLQSFSKKWKCLYAIISRLLNAWLQIIECITFDLLKLSCIILILTDHQCPTQPFLKLSHLILNSLLSTNNRNATIFNTIAYVLLASSPIKTLICTFKVCLLPQEKNWINK